MYSVMFVCHGNICRSPMAEFIFRDAVKKAGRTGEFLSPPPPFPTRKFSAG
ncbi:MAG: hypothetical protein ACLS4Z_04330 [Christensenellaceae bacterium]